MPDETFKLDAELEFRVNATRDGARPPGKSLKTSTYQEISRMRYLLPFPILIAVLLNSFTALGADEPSFELSLGEQKFCLRGVDHPRLTSA